MFLLAGIAAAVLTAHRAHAEPDSAAPSLACTVAKTWIEKSVCGSDRLIDLDLQVTLAYARLLRGTDRPGKRALETEQRQWWRTRDACKGEADLSGCLASLYEQRLAWLDSRIAAGGGNVVPLAGPASAAKEPKPDRARGIDATATPSTTSLPGASPETALAARTADPAAAPAADADPPWSRDLGRYGRALTACREESPAPIAKVLVAWPSAAQDVIGARLVDVEKHEWVCIAHVDGHRVVRFGAPDSGETLPEAGPVLHVGARRPPRGCPRPAPVLDPQGRTAGWLTESDC
jgi:uncharacterized protein